MRKGPLLIHFLTLIALSRLIAFGMRTVLGISRRAVLPIGISFALWYSITLCALNGASGGGYIDNMVELKDIWNLAHGIGREDPFAHLRGLRLAVVEQTSYHDGL